MSDPESGPCGREGDEFEGGASSGGISRNSVPDTVPLAWPSCVWIKALQIGGRAVNFTCNPGRSAQRPAAGQMSQKGNERII
ncbi:hypothetical protein DPEC_G00231030 [Dallia pectoralis]|uniref:Uncharacterized protein n=1 Tax=Dallia pectoralis TaxID=75939 RepID=A0ACC2FX35_DALPE|nr:hypothetical protein DPEC_G00231030 [Dallia pectoralis]